MSTYLWKGITEVIWSYVKENCYLLKRQHKVKEIYSEFDAAYYGNQHYIQNQYSILTQHFLR